MHNTEEASKIWRWKCQKPRLTIHFVYCKQLAVSMFHKWLETPREGWCPSSETRHLARQVGGASADFFFIDLEFISMIFIKLCIALFIRNEICI